MPNRKKKISRNYRVTIIFDLIVKRGAKILGSSEADFVELCVLGQAEEAISRQKGLEKLARDDDDSELRLWVFEASKLLRDRLTRPQKKD